MKHYFKQSQYLLEAIAQGSTDAFEQFYEKYHTFVFSIALKVLNNPQEAEDLCHDIFIEIAKKAESYDPSKGSVEAWIAIRTRSRCIDFLRKKREVLTDEFEEKLASSKQSPIEEQVIARLDRSVLSQAMKKLPDAQRKAIYGNYYEQLTHRELASNLNLPLGTVKSLIRYGLRNLRKQFLQSKALRGDEKNDV